MDNPLIVYHANCSDGFAAAWAVRRRHPGADLYAATYQTPPPDVSGRDVVVVDFSFPRDVTENLQKGARSFFLLDHHVTAQDALAGLSGCYFDRSRSGAEIAWDWFFPGEPRPVFLSYIGDGDRWAWELQDSRIINEYLRIVPKTLPEYDKLATVPKELLVYRGEIARLSSQNYREIVVENALQARIQGAPNSTDPRFLEFTLAVNAPPWNHSELLADIALMSPVGYAFSYYQKRDGSWTYSFRAVPGGPNVAEFAKLFGGGGHPAAASFRSTLPIHETKAR